MYSEFLYRRELRQHDLLRRECETNVLSIEIRFVHMPVKAGMAAVRIGVLETDVVVMNSKYFA